MVPCAIFYGQIQKVWDFCNREFKLHVSGNGKRQARTFLAKFSLNVFVSYFLSCVERIIMYFSFKTASLLTLYCLIPKNFSLLGVWRITRSLNSLFAVDESFWYPISNQLSRNSGLRNWKNSHAHSLANSHQLLFLFDRGMRVEKTLMQSLASQLSSTLILIQSTLINFHTTLVLVWPGHLHYALRPIQTGRDSATRRGFSVFKNKQNRQRIKILQGMQTK
jgi:hypothetical protein